MPSSDPLADHPPPGMSLEELARALKDSDPRAYAERPLPPAAQSCSRWERVRLLQKRQAAGLSLFNGKDQVLLRKGTGEDPREGAIGQQPGRRKRR